MEPNVGEGEATNASVPVGEQNTMDGETIRKAPDVDDSPEGLELERRLIYDSSDSDEMFERKERPPPVATLLKTIRQVGLSDEQNPRFRRTMEDGHTIEDEIDGPGTCFLAVYDGHGGRAAVEIVQEKMAENFKKALQENPNDMNAVWLQCYKETDDNINEKDVQFAGSTVATAFIRKEGDKRMLYTANAGDARIVLLHGGEKWTEKRMTYDHKASDEDEQNRVRADGGFIAFNRVNALLAVSRSLGDHAMKQYVPSTPYTDCVELSADDHTLIVACDGIWDVIDDNNVHKSIDEIDPNRENAQKASDELLGKALEYDFWCI